CEASVMRIRRAARVASRPSFPVLALACALVAAPARAADLLPPGGLEPGAVAAVSKADASGDGSVHGAITVRAAEAAAAARAIDPALADETSELLRDANVASVLLGLGVARSLDLSLGLYGTYEHVRAPERDALFPVRDPTVDDNWRGSTRQTAFAGASL